MSEPGTELLEADQDPPTDTPQYFVPTNAFTMILQDTLGFTTDHICIPDEDVYDTQYTLLYWNFTKIIEWCHLKSNSSMIRGGKYFEDGKINRLQALAWWVKYLALRGKNPI